MSLVKQGCLKILGDLQIEMDRLQNEYEYAVPPRDQIVAHHIAMCEREIERTQKLLKVMNDTLREESASKIKSG